MAKTKISEFSSTASNNTDIDSINISEGCAPSGINDAIRELMSQLKDFQTGAQGDSFNGPVGTTTAAAGAFTTLSASSTVTLSGGTANGVLYLNGSKVATSGSALTFDGTNLGVITSSGADTTLLTLTGNSGIRQQFNPTNASATKYNWRIDVNGLVDQSWSLVPSTAVGGSTFSTPVYQANGNGTQIWSVGSSEQMRLTSTGLGIGTSSPATKLQVAGEIRSSADISNSSDAVVYSYSGGSAGSVRSGLQMIGSTQEFRIYTAGSARAYVDSSGNLGLGVTPSAWSGTKALQFDYGSFSSSSTLGLDVAGNGYYNGTNWIYRLNAKAFRYNQTDSGHAWFNAGTGTAGNAITFTQAMTLAASGGLSVGTTTDAGTGNIGLPAGGQLRYSSTAYITPEDNVSGARIVTGGIIRFDSGGTSERARFDASGNLLVGTTTSSGPLTVATSTEGASIVFQNTNTNVSSSNKFGYVIKEGASDVVYLRYRRDGSGVAELFNQSAILAFGTGNTERARIDSSGNFIMSGGTVYFVDATRGIRGGASGQTIVVADSGGFYQQVGGNYYLVTTAGGSTSDANLKTNVQQLSGALDKVCAIRGVNFEFIEDPMCTADKGTQLGVIAQEVEAQYPEIVLTDDNGTKTVRYDRLVAPLIEAIKEQQAIIESLKARLDAANL